MSVKKYKSLFYIFIALIVVSCGSKEDVFNSNQYTDIQKSEIKSSIQDQNNWNISGYNCTNSKSTIYSWPSSSGSYSSVDFDFTGDYIWNFDEYFEMKIVFPDSTPEDLQFKQQFMRFMEQLFLL